MSGLRSRIERLARPTGEPSPEPVVLHFELFGDDDHGGGWRDREPGDYSDVTTQMADGRTVIVRPVACTDPGG
jgi:hypothetical protein